MSAARQRWMTSPHRILILFFIQTMDRTSRDHGRRQCSELGNIRDHDPHKVYERRVSTATHSMPFALAEGLAGAERFPLVSNFTEFIICTQKSFGDLIARITQAATEDVKTIKQACKPVKRKRVLTKKYSKQRPR
jgi:hypothetical protein